MKHRHERAQRSPRRSAHEAASASRQLCVTRAVPLARPHGLHERDLDAIRRGETVAIEHVDGRTTIHNADQRLRCAMLVAAGETLVVGAALEDLPLLRIVVARSIALRVIREAA